MAGRKTDFKLNVDELFTSQEERDEAKLAKIKDIPIELIDDFSNHPYKVLDNEDMYRLVDSIKMQGIITPATVMKKDDGRYEMISGHRRKRASVLAGLKTLRCEVVELTRDEAVIRMVESNFQRSEILPSEKAFAYKMRLDAMNSQGKRNDLTSTPLVSKSRSNEVLGVETGESREQIRRYIRLTNLVPELLQMVDEGKIKLRPAVEISYLDEDTQRDLVDAIDVNLSTPSHAQAIRIRKLYESGDLTENVIDCIMEEEKPNQKEHISISTEKVKDLLPQNISERNKQSYIVNALKFYKEFLNQRDERDDR